MTPLKRVARIQYGLGQPPPLSESGIPIIRATNISRGQITEKDLLRAKPENLPLNRAPLLTEGEILVVRSGAHTGDSARVPREWAGSAPGYDLRVTPLTIDSRYAAWSLLSSAAVEQMKLASSRAAQSHLNAEELGAVEINLPPLAEQHRIADFLDAETARMDALLAHRTRQTALLEQSDDSVVTEMLDRASGQPARLKHLATKITSGPRGWGDLVADSGSLFLRITNIPRRGIQLDLRDSLYVDAEPGPERERSRTHVGDILVSITADIGSVALVDERGADGNVSQHVALVRPNPTTCSPKWLAYALKSARSKQTLRMNSYGGTKVGLGLGDIANLDLDVPSLPAQEVIAARIEDALERREMLRRAMSEQIDLLKERRQALITAAVTGQFDVSTASGRNVTEGVSA
nr:restriction endonuclease subunit S [Streptomyces sp. JB150]